MVHFIMITSAAKRLKNGSGRLPALQIGSRGEEELSRRECGINALFTEELNLASRSSVAVHLSKPARFPFLLALPRGRPESQVKEGNEQELSPGLGVCTCAPLNQRWGADWGEARNRATALTFCVPFCFGLGSLAGQEDKSKIRGFNSVTQNYRENPKKVSVQNEVPGRLTRGRALGLVLYVEPFI